VTSCTADLPLATPRKTRGGTRHPSRDRTPWPVIPRVGDGSFPLCRRNHPRQYADIGQPPAYPRGKPSASPAPRIASRRPGRCPERRGMNTHDREPRRLVSPVPSPQLRDHVTAVDSPNWTVRCASVQRIFLVTASTKPPLAPPSSFRRVIPIPPLGGRGATPTQPPEESRQLDSPGRPTNSPSKAIQLDLASAAPERG
jgi:hypothetical protein